MKYFILGGFSSAFFLYGIALIYGAVGSTNLGEIVAAFDDVDPVERNDAMLLAGVALLIVGFAFKVAAVPFHVWSPDVYEGAPTPMHVADGVDRQGRRRRRPGAGARRRPRLLPRRLAPGDLGAGGRLGRRRLGPRRGADRREADAGVLVDHPRRLHPRRRSSRPAHHAGEADSGPGVPAVAFYLLAYAVIVAGTFGVVALVARTGDGATDLDSFRGLGHRHPALSLGLTVFLLAQAGVPFTSGFIAKFGVIAAGRRRAQLRARHRRHAGVRDRCVPLPADHGQRVDAGRDRGRRRRARAGAVRQRPLRSRRPPRSRCSSGSCPAGCSTPPTSRSTSPSSPSTERPVSAAPYSVRRGRRRRGRRHPRR